MANQHFSSIWKNCFYVFQTSNKAVTIVLQKTLDSGWGRFDEGTWRIIPVSKWLGSPPIYIAMNDHVGPTTLSLGYLRSPWLLTIFESWDDHNQDMHRLAQRVLLGRMVAAGLFVPWTFANL